MGLHAAHSHVHVAHVHVHVHAFSELTRNMGLGGEIAALRARLAATYDLDHAGAAPLAAALAELASLLTPQDLHSPHSLAQNTALDEYMLADLGEEALGLLLLVPDGSGSLRTPEVATARLCAALDDAPNLSGSLASLDSAAVRIFCDAALALLQQTPLLAPPPRPQATPRPVSAPGHPVRYLTEEEKARLNAKYGKLTQPTPQDMHSVLSSGANCKMQ